LSTIIIVASLLFSGLFSGNGQTPNGQTTHARIKIDIDRTIGEINPLLFGNFAQHLGRMIYGGFIRKAVHCPIKMAIAKKSSKPSSN
jgi:hypothetical protein